MKIVKYGDRASLTKPTTWEKERGREMQFDITLEEFETQLPNQSHPFRIQVELERFEAKDLERLLQAQIGIEVRAILNTNIKTAEKTGQKYELPTVVQFGGSREKCSAHQGGRGRGIVDPKAAFAKYLATLSHEDRMKELERLMGEM